MGRKDAVGKPVLFGTTDKFLKRFQISSLDELPDYEELINKIQLIRGVQKDDDYLYSKDVYVEESVSTESGSSKEVAPTKVQTEDFDLPDIDDEEIPDFLIGEEVEKF